MTSVSVEPAVNQAVVLATRHHRESFKRWRSFPDTGVVPSNSHDGAGTLRVSGRRKIAPLVREIASSGFRITTRPSQFSSFSRVWVPGFGRMNGEAPIGQM